MPVWIFLRDPVTLLILIDQLELQRLPLLVLPLHEQLQQVVRGVIIIIRTRLRDVRRVRSGLLRKALVLHDVAVGHEHELVEEREDLTWRPVDGVVMTVRPRWARSLSRFTTT